MGWRDYRWVYFRCAACGKADNAHAESECGITLTCGTCAVLRLNRYSEVCETVAKNITWSDGRG